MHNVFFGDLEGIFLVIYIIAMLLSSGLSIVSYVFHSLGVYTIAKRRYIHKPWLAWIPVGSSWILGSISDQYQYVVKGKIKNKRKILLVLEIVLCLLIVMYLPVAIGLMAAMYQLPDDSIAVLIGILGYAGLLYGTVIAVAVFQYIALYDLYGSCDPKNQVVFLLLSIFVSITMPFLVFGCRNKDLGMPPRKVEFTKMVIPPQPVVQPEPEAVQEEELAQPEPETVQEEEPAQPVVQPVPESVYEWEPPKPEQAEETIDPQ